jgi:folate-binding protein YgfZ
MDPIDPQTPTFLKLAARAVLAVGGPDRAAFLQGLITNDIGRVAPARAIHAAMLTPQGRILDDFAIAALGDRYLFDVEAEGREALAKRLATYRLRAKVAIEPCDGWIVAALPGGAAIARLGLPAEPGAAMPAFGGVAFVDPRLPALGARLMAPAAAADALLAAGWQPAGAAAYETMRLSLGVPEGRRDLANALPMENGFDALNALDWKKGCYVGQEVTARMRYRGLAKKRLVPVRIEGPPPPPGTIVTLDGQDAGEMRSSAGDRGLALLRLEAIEACMRDGAVLSSGEARLVPGRPAWLAAEG